MTLKGLESSYLEEFNPELPASSPPHHHSPWDQQEQSGEAWFLLSLKCRQRPCYQEVYIVARETEFNQIAAQIWGVSKKGSDARKAYHKEADITGEEGFPEEVRVELKLKDEHALNQGVRGERGKGMEGSSRQNKMNRAPVGQNTVDSRR